MKQLSVSDITFLAMMTCCNAVLELTLGSFLHVIGFSMKGSVMVGINLIVYAVVFSRLKRFGMITVCGAATSFVNFLIAGGFKFFALYCIVFEAAAADIIISLFGINKKSLCAAGSAAGLLACICGLFNGIIIMGLDPSSVINRLAQLNLGTSSLSAVVAFMIISRIAVGIIFGLAADKVCRICEKNFKKFQL